jgi:hypothetical protein
MVSNRGGGERPCAAHIQLNKRIMGARDADDILAIVEAEHGLQPASESAPKLCEWPERGRAPSAAPSRDRDSTCPEHERAGRGEHCLGSSGNGNSDCQTSTWSFLGSTCEANCAGELADVPADVAGIKIARADGRDRAIGDQAIVNDIIAPVCVVDQPPARISSAPPEPRVDLKACYDS